MHTLPLLLVLFAAPLAETEGDSEPVATDPGNDSESEGLEDTGTDDPHGGPPGPKPKAKGCRLASDDLAAALFLLPMLLIRRR
jgi:hypothetical protein